jgi:hypothetical protein
VWGDHSVLKAILLGVRRIAASSLTKGSAGAADGSFQKEFGSETRQRQRRVCCDQSAVTVRIGARLASAEFAPLPWTGSTSRTSDSEYLFCADGLLHGPERMLRRPSAGVVNFEQVRRLFVRDL